MATMLPQLLTPAEIAKGDWTIPRQLTTPPIPEEASRITTIFSHRFLNA